MAIKKEELFGELRIGSATQGETLSADRIREYFNFYEQHILPTAFINMFGPASFIVVKIVVMIAVLLAIDRLSKDREFNTYIKIVIGILGAATGGRDFLALFSLV